MLATIVSQVALCTALPVVSHLILKHLGNTVPSLSLEMRKGGLRKEGK